MSHPFKLIHIPKAIHISFSCYMVKISVQVTETTWLRLGKDCSKTLKNAMLIVGRKLDENRSLWCCHTIYQEHQFSP